MALKESYYNFSVFVALPACRIREADRWLNYYKKSSLKIVALSEQ